MNACERLFDQDAAPLALWEGKPRHSVCAVVVKQNAPVPTRDSQRIASPTIHAKRLECAWL
jgi:hypothetical protein